MGFREKVDSTLLPVETPYGDLFDPTVVQGMEVEEVSADEVAAHQPMLSLEAQMSRMNPEDIFAQDEIEKQLMYQDENVVRYKPKMMQKYERLRKALKGVRR